MRTIILTVADIRSIVNHIGLDNLVDELIEQLTDAFTKFDEGYTKIPPRSGFEYHKPNYGLLEWMPAMTVGKTAVVKMVGYHPTNPNLRNLPTVLSTVSLYDTASGHLIGMVDATFMTALRTGATSAIASKLLASPNANCVTLIGAGAQGMTQIHTLSRVLPIETVYVYDIDSSARESFLERASFMGVNLVPVTNSMLNIAIKKCDILCTATSVELGSGPVFMDTETKPDLHINAVGTDTKGKQEIPLSLLKRSTVFPDFPAQALEEGECQYLSSDDMGPSLTQLLQNPTKYQHLQDQLTVFDSTGWALADKVAMELLINHAKRMNLGSFLQIESVSYDPLNPYQFIRTNGMGNGYYN